MTDTVPTPGATPGLSEPLIVTGTGGVAATPFGADTGVPLPSRRRGPFGRAFAQIRRDPVTMVALGWIVIVGVIAILGIFWTPHPPNKQLVADALLAPFEDWSVPLGTDDLGRDVVSRMMAGALVSLQVSFVVVGSALVIALPIGLYAGYRGGYVDTAIMRVLDAITSIPGIVAALAIVSIMGRGMTNLMIALTIIMVPNFVRLVRAQSLAVSAEPYIAASRSVGSRMPWILLMRVLPGVIPALSVQVSLALGGALTAEAALSFLGLGVVPPDASWGNVLQRAYQNILVQPSGVYVPIFFLGTVVLAFNLVGDGIRDATGAGVGRGARKRAKNGLTTVRRGEVTRVEPRAVDAAPDRPRPRLEVRDLCVSFETFHGTLSALDHVSLEVAPGEVLGIVGESGSGKTVTALSIMRLLQSPPGVITGGSIVHDGVDLLGLSLAEMRQIRGARISMVFQNPMTSLDPTFTIGNSLREAIRNHERMSKRQANERAVELLDLVGIPAARHRLDDYPHQFSGGMRQRAMIAMALAGRPNLLIADEPTTALDVTIQAQIIDLLDRLRRELDMSVILVTHDLGVVAQICDRVSVMYAGHIVESAPIEELFASPVHPYTAGLLSAVPSMASGQRRLAALPGSVPQLDSMPAGCRFSPRCPYAEERCIAGVPPLEVVRGHDVRCVRADELTLVRS